MGSYTNIQLYKRRYQNPQKLTQTCCSDLNLDRHKTSVMVVSSATVETDFIDSTFNRIEMWPSFRQIKQLRLIICFLASTVM